MPELVYSDDELGLQPGWDNGLDPNIRQDLRSGKLARRQLKKAQKEVETLKRERAFTQAGIPADERGTAFAKVYEGDSADPAVVKAAFEGLFGPIGQIQEPTTAGDQRIQAATASGVDAPQGGSVDLADAIKGAKTQEEVLEIIRNAPPVDSSLYGRIQLRLPED